MFPPNYIPLVVILLLILLGIVALLIYINRLRRKTQIAAKQQHLERAHIFTNVMDEFRNHLTTIQDMATHLKEMMEEGREDSASSSHQLESIERNTHEILSLLNQHLKEPEEKLATQETQSIPENNSPSQETLSERNQRARDKQFIERFKQLIIREIGGGKSPSVSSAAEVLNMSPSQLTRRIKAITGISPAAYIMQIRMEEAKRLLAIYPPIPIANIVFLTGFADQPHFTRVFRQYFKVTPSQYRATTTT